MINLISKWVIKYRLFVLIILLLLTFGFCYYSTGLKVYTDFKDLLPSKHPYIEVYKSYRDVIGGANLLLIGIEVKNGNIFNPATLEKIKYISNEIEKFKGVDRYKILSIARRKVKDIKVGTWGIETHPIMWPDIPKNDEEMENMKRTVFSNDAFYGSLVSIDCKGAVVLADFFEEDIDYQEIFTKLKKMQKELEDENTVISITGHPMHLGYVRSHLYDVLYIFAVTVLVMVILFYFAFWSRRLMFLPLIAAAISACWGLAVMRFVGYHLDPLILVLPFLISAMAASHTHQVIKRFQEEFALVDSKEIDSETSKLIAQRTLEYMMLPGFVSIITDASGIILIGLAFIPILDSVALPCFIWAFITLVIAFMFSPIVLSYLPVKRDFLDIEIKDRAINKFFRSLGLWIVARGKWYVIVVTVILVILTGYFATKAKVGDMQPGSAILWSDSRYNIDANKISGTFMGIQYPLYAIFEGKEFNMLKTSKYVCKDMEAFQKYVYENNPYVVGTDSVVDSLKKVFMKFHEDDPKWQYVPKSGVEMGNFFYFTVTSGDPGDWDRYVFNEDSSANVTLYLKDKKGETLRSVMKTVNDYIRNKSIIPSEEGKYRLAGGVAGVEFASNDSIEKSLQLNVFLSIAICFIFCAVFYRSIVAGIILVIHLQIANLVGLTYMVFRDVGFTVATFPVISVAMGLGVDYGIYVVSRVQDELKVKGKNLDEAIISALVTTGKAVVLICAVMIGGIIFWYFSALRFQAEMGFMIGLLLFVDMLGAVLLVPSLISVFKPKFLQQ